MATADNVRVSDADRDFTAAQLREHYVQGRLTHEELDQRLEQTFRAKTRPELDAVTTDLPYAAATGILPSDRVRAGGGAGSNRQGWNQRGHGWDGSSWAGPGWDGHGRSPRGGRRGSAWGFLRVIPLLASVAICLLVLSALGFGFGSAPSLWVVILGAVAALRWLFGLRRRPVRGPRGPRGPRRRW
jgi:Domain of unknown function (DUF1707)